MILTGSEIKHSVRMGLISINPFNEQMLNPNSYNYHLGPTIKTLDDLILEPLSQCNYRETVISEGGMVLQPRKVYLGHTVEMIGSEYYVPSLIGRSSLGRLGVFLQISADLGNLGPVHRWTLEIVVSQPIRLYSGMVVGQVSFWVPVGDMMPYSGYFGNFSDPTETVSWLLGIDKEETIDLDRT